MNKALESLLDNGCELGLIKQDGKLFYTIDGFYKYGQVKMFISDKNDELSPLMCSTRYDIERLIYSFDDLKKWNIEVHEMYKNDFNGWNNIEYPFNNIE